MDHSNARKSPTVPQTQMIISHSPNTTLTRKRSFEFTDPDDHFDFPRTQARRASKGHSNACKSPTVPQTQMIISYSPNTSLTRQRSFELTDPDDHQPTQMIISNSPNTRPPRQRGSFKRPQESHSPTVPQTQMIIRNGLGDPDDHQKRPREPR